LSVARMMILTLTMSEANTPRIDSK